MGEQLQEDQDLAIDLSDLEEKDQEDSMQWMLGELFRCFGGSKLGPELIDQEEIEILSSQLSSKSNKVYIKCLKREKELVLKPEEVIRQWFLNRLIQKYGYDLTRIRVEYAIKMGASSKKADIVILNSDDPSAVDLIVELKKAENKKGRDQLKSYCNATGAPIGVWTNGSQITYYHRKEPNLFENLTDIPMSNQTVSDILTETFTLKDLIVNDKIANQRKSLREVIVELEDEVFANSGEDVFEEVFKLIFVKLYDEYRSLKDKVIIDHFVASNQADQSNYSELQACVASIDDSQFRSLEFRNRGDSTRRLQENLQELFDFAKDTWQGIFEEGAKIELQPDHLAVCVSSLQDVKLFNSNLMVIDEAFEHLISQHAKGSKGQFFTPRHVIDMCVKMLNPRPGEYMIDTASGSCGFPVHTIFHLNGELFTNRIADMSPDARRNVKKIFGIDFDKSAVRVARTLNLIAGDGGTNVLELNTLDFAQWDKRLSDTGWRERYSSGYSELVKRRMKRNDNQKFDFDIVMANPPFAGEIREPKILNLYELASDGDDLREGVSRHVLFLERNLDFLKPGGRMAIVLPEGLLNNPSQQYVREYLLDRVRLLAVVSLHINTFKPHTGTKTSVVFVQKWTDNDGVCPRVDEYDIFFAISELPGKDNSGDYVYVKNNEGITKLDTHGHLMIQHDLHDHDGSINEQIAERFIQWASDQNLSFF